MPLLLLFLSIPIPEILFNKIAFPLQLLASRLAGIGLRLLGVPTVSYGNVLEIPFRGTGEVVSLEVVEACSGIRSLVTLISLALILGYFTRDRQGSFGTGWKRPTLSLGAARWASLYGPQRTVKTPVLDALSRSASAAYNGVTRFATRPLRYLPWKPWWVVGVAAGWVVIGSYLLRRL